MGFVPHHFGEGFEIEELRHVPHPHQVVRHAGADEALEGDDADEFVIGVEDGKLRRVVFDEAVDGRFERVVDVEVDAHRVHDVARFEMVGQAVASRLEMLPDGEGGTERPHFPRRVFVGEGFLQAVQDLLVRARQIDGDEHDDDDVEAFAAEGGEGEACLRGGDADPLGESGQALNSVIRYSFVDEDWETLNSSGPSARYSSASSQLTIYMYIIGGIDNSQNLLNEVWSFPIFGSLWTQKAVIPEAQHSGFSFAVNNFIYAGLGFTSTDNSTYSNRFFMYEEAPEEQGGVWTELNTMPGTKAVGGTVIDNAIYIADDSGYLHIFNTQTKEWTTCLTRIPVDNRSIHCMFGFSRNNYIYFGLGNNGNELMRYDPGWDN